MNESHVPAALFDVVRRDLKPVRPLASPARRALALLPLAIALLVGVPEFWTWKTHHALPSWPTWGWSMLETALSLVILTMGFREAVPGRATSARALSALVFVACACFLLINLTTVSPAGISRVQWIRWLGECVSLAMTFSIPALIAPAWLVFRALPIRPALTGALCGFGVGMMADAGLRLTCLDGDYVHVLVAHGGAIALLSGLGALSALLAEHLRARPRMRVR